MSNSPAKVSHVGLTENVCRRCECGSGAFRAPVDIYVSVFPGRHWNESLCPNAELSLGSCAAIVEVESSADSVASEECTVDSSSSGCQNIQGCSSFAKAPGARPERMESGVIDAMSVESDMSNRKREGFKRTETGKLPSSQYKGVVPQPNGRWGAQIYEKHNRVWLGTFNDEQDAATAYDTAVFKFRGCDAVTNFAPLQEDHPEAVFLRRHSKSEIVDMLRKHTFHEELEQSVKNSKAEATDAANPDGVAGSNPSRGERSTYPPEHLFDKTVTPSDVGKLNRLVIPKQHAEKYFPIDITFPWKGLLLNFEDSSGKTWRFRYSYWNSSQSYVLTKGWSRFIKEKRLEAGDIVTFERSTGGSRQLYISFRRGPRNAVQKEPHKPAAPPGLLLPRQFVCPFTGYPQWTHLFTSQPPVPQSTVAHITLSSGAPPNSCVLTVDEARINTKSASNDGESSPLKFVNLVKENSVMLFGANLSPSSSSELNLFPSNAAAEEQRNPLISEAKAHGFIGGKKR